MSSQPNETAGKFDDTGFRALMDFAQKAYWDGVNLLFKAVGFYFAILAFLVGYIVSQKPAPGVTRITLAAGIGASILAYAVLLDGARGLSSCAKLIQDIVKHQDPTFAEKLQLDVFFSGWQALIRRTRIAFCILILMFVVGMMALIAIFK